MEKWIELVLGDALQGSVQIKKERFGICQYNPKQQRIVKAIPAHYFERAGLVRQDAVSVTPDESLMEMLRRFNRGEKDILFFNSKDNISRTDYTFMKQDGLVVPYHTHLGENDLFSSKGGRGEDVDFTFGTNDMLMDIVISEDAKRKRITPPVCATFNPKYFPFKEKDVPYVDLTPEEFEKIDAQRGYAPGTTGLLTDTQILRKIHMSIDFVVD